jgi:hypothetical protein
MLGAQRDRLRNQRTQFNEIQLTEEALEILNGFDPQDLQLMLQRNTQALRRPSALVRPTMQRNTRRDVFNFFNQEQVQNPPNRQNNQQNEVENNAHQRPNVNNQGGNRTIHEENVPRNEQEMAQNQRNNNNQNQPNITQYFDRGNQ